MLFNILGENAGLSYTLLQLILRTRGRNCAFYFFFRRKICCYSEFLAVVNDEAKVVQSFPGAISCLFV